MKRNEDVRNVGSTGWTITALVTPRWRILTGPIHLSVGYSYTTVARSHDGDSMTVLRTR
jgi:hypothetical protein